MKRFETDTLEAHAPVNRANPDTITDQLRVAPAIVVAASNPMS
jgi:hypothetical protein